MQYSRITSFREIGKSHKELKNKTAAIIGLGAIGSNSAMMLAKSGIGKLIIADRDIVELENIPLTPYLKNDIGKPKPLALKEILLKANNQTKTEEIPEDIDHKNIGKIKADIFLDSTDNLETRFLLNDHCLKNKIPLVHASALGSLITIFNVSKGACLGCIYSGKISNETCESFGILPSAALLAASIQVNEAVKILLNKDFEKDLIRLDVWNNSLIKIKTRKNERCSAHKGNFEYLKGKGAKIVKMCGSGIYQVKGRKINIKKISKTIKGKNFGYCISSGKITVFEDGRALVKANSEAEAKSIYSKIIGN